MSAYSAAGDVVDNSEPTSAPGITTTTATSTDEPIMTPRDVEELFESSNQQEAQLSTYRRQDEEDEEENISNEENSWRVEQLSRVLSTLSKLLDSGSTELDTVVQKVGDGSRDPSWRLPLGQSGILGFFLGLIGKNGLRQATTIHALRVIGNSCADIGEKAHEAFGNYRELDVLTDADENRARVVASECIPRMVSLLDNDSILAFVIPALFNMCVDYEPAQAAAYKAGINPELVALISSPRIANARDLMNIICKLLALVANQEPEANLVHPATPFVLLSLATSPGSLADLELFLGQTSIALTYLSNETFQNAYLQTPQSVPLFLKAFSKSCVNFDLKTAHPDEAAQLKNVKSIFTQALADISASPLFATACPVGGAEIQTLYKWIGTPYNELQSAACLALGNIARSDDVCITLVQQSGLHRPLISILADPSMTDAQLLYSTLSFLKNLTIPTVNKATLGDACLLEAHVLPRIWALDAQIQVQFTAVSLTRLLLISSPENVKRMCTPLSTNMSSPVYEQTQLNTLMCLFMRSDQEPTKTEAARAVTAVLRVLHSSPDASKLLPVPTIPSSRRSSLTPYTQPPGSSPGETLASSHQGPAVSAPPAIEAFYTNHDTLSNALIYLGTQQKFPVLRSELWFVMALMSRSRPGAHVVATCLQHIELLRSLIQTITGHDMLERKEVELLSAVGNPHGPAIVGSVPTGNFIAGSQIDNPGALIPGVPGLEPQQVDPAKKADMARVDRENGLVLVAELLRRCPEKLRVLPQGTFREILETGSANVLRDRDGNGDH